LIALIVVHLITARPRDPEIYQRVAFAVALSDLAILELRYYKAGDPVASRIVRSPRASILAWRGNLIPTRIEVENLLRGSETEVEISELEVDPEIDDRVFSRRARAQRRLDAAGERGGRRRTPDRAARRQSKRGIVLGRRSRIGSTSDAIPRRLATGPGSWGLRRS
jgi:hypothetical protein